MVEEELVQLEAQVVLILRHIKVVTVALDTKMIFTAELRYIGPVVVVVVCGAARSPGPAEQVVKAAEVVEVATMDLVELVVLVD